VCVIAVSVSHSRDHLVGVVDALDEAGAKQPAAMHEDAAHVEFEALRDDLERSDIGARMLLLA
jgi:hypothetical protein